MTHLTARTLAALALTMACGSAAVAQDDDWINGSGSMTGEATAERSAEISWSDADLQKVGEMLTGSWKTASEVADSSGEGSTALVMNIAPVAIEGMPDALYVETARAGELYSPVRHAFFQLYKSKGEIRVRTLDVAFNDGRQASVLTGMWALPAHFPQVTRDDLIATLDIVLKPNSGGFAGKTPYPYPTAMGDAVEMTSELTIAQNKIVANDKGMNADGSVAWGGTPVTFERTEPAVKPQQMNGVTVLDFVNPGETVVANNDRLHTRYWGYLPTGEQFDSSERPGRSPLVFPFPPGQRFIVGFGAGMDGLSIGTHRRVVIPSDLGYGPSGNPRAGIPGNMDLIFDLAVLHIDKAEPQVPTGDSGAIEDHSGHDHSGDSHEGHDH